MLEAIEKIHQYTANRSKQDLLKDPMVLDAVVWNLTVLGEAAREVPDFVTEIYPEIPWAQIRGTRNHIVHGYD